MKLGFAVILTGIVKAIYKVLEVVAIIILELLVYFGLWIPTVYMIITGICMLTGNLDLSQYNVSTIIFYIGLALCLLGSLVITIRHLIINPIGDIIEERKVKKQFKHNQELEKQRMMYENDPAKYYAKYEGQAPHPSHPVYRQDKNERKENHPPLVYRSNVDPSIIVHEYKDYFEVYREDPHGNVARIDIREKLIEDGKTKKKKRKKDKK